MTKLIPLEDHIVVKPMNEETTTKSGIILPESKEKPSKGKVVAVGNGKIWDIVYFAKYSIDELEVDEDGKKEKYLVMKQSYIMAKEG